MKNNFLNDTDNLKLCFWYVFSPFLCGAISVALGYFYFYLTSEYNLMEKNWIFSKFSSAFPILVWLACALFVSIWKRLYRFPARAPKGTPYYKTARFAWVIHHMFYIALIVMLIFVL